MYTLLVVLLILMLIGVLPQWPYAAGWGYAPSGLMFVVVIVLVILLATGRL